MHLLRRSAYEFGGKEAQEEDAQAQAPQDAEEDAVATQALGLTEAPLWSLFLLRFDERPRFSGPFRV
jgi:hypothetical protein